jgi:hypothetical protein
MEPYILRSAHETTELITITKLILKLEERKWKEHILKLRKVNISDFPKKSF